jgi:type I restriction enzyme S subunit
MSADWPRVLLGEVLNQVSDPHAVRADQSYPNFGIYSFGRGLFEKPPISGTATSARTLFRVKVGHFIYSRLFAFEGAYGLVTDRFDGRFVSNEYPTFECVPNRLHPAFLAAFFRWQQTWQSAAEMSIGMGGRRQRIQPDQLLKYPIPLPPLAEQRRIVARVDAIANRVAEARRLREEIDRDIRDRCLPLCG